MGLPKKFDDRLKNNLGLRAVWLPGTQIDLGAVLQLKDGIFESIANLSDFGVNFRWRELGGDLSLKFQARGVSSMVFQAGAQVDLSHVDIKANTELKIDFKEEDTYFIRAPKLSGIGISNLMTVAKAVARLSEWQHRRYFIAWNVYRAGEFVFLGSQSRNKSVRFQGSGSDIIDFLTVGASANVAKVTASSVNIEIMGKGGPLALRVTRIKKNGRPF